MTKHECGLRQRALISSSSGGCDDVESAANGIAVATSMLPRFMSIVDVSGPTDAQLIDRFDERSRNAVAAG